MKKILVTGSSGLIGSEVVRYFDNLGFQIFGIDNNMRADFLVLKVIQDGIKNSLKRVVRISITLK